MCLIEGYNVTSVGPTRIRGLNSRNALMGLSLQLTTVEGGAALGTIGGPRSKAAKSNRS
jgi:hypothetical protein